MSPGQLFVLSAPSGAGKTTVCHGVVARDPNVVLSVSHTTRRPRPHERDGVEYHFVDTDEFRKLVAEGAFLEHAEYSGNLYGTSWRAIEAPLASGRDVLLEIETEGARQVRERRPDAHLVFLLPPSLALLEARLRGRGTERSEEVDRRLAIARREFAAARGFEFFVVNEVAERAIEDVLALVAAARSGALGALRERFGLARLRATLDPALAAWLPD
ncbi:MAG: guanylate kinase [Proteobacteria bacterium]|nr:MAG: guanylate kinase [Pseudomonadota bacterium]